MVSVTVWAYCVSFYDSVMTHTSWCYKREPCINASSERWFVWSHFFSPPLKCVYIPSLRPERIHISSKWATHSHKVQPLQEGDVLDEGFHFHADGLRNTAKRVSMHNVLSSAPPLEEVISSPAKELILWVRTQEVRPSLHSCSTSGRSLRQEGPVLAASHCYHFWPLYFSSLPLFPSW